MANSVIDVTKWWREAAAGVVAIAAAAGGYYIWPVSRDLGFVLYAVAAVDVVAYGFVLLSRAKKKSDPPDSSPKGATDHE